MFGSKHRAEKQAAAEEARAADLRQAVVHLISLAQGDNNADRDFLTHAQVG